MGGAIALLSKPEALHLPRQGHDVAVGETVRIARRPGDGGLIKAAAAEIVAPVAERACEQPILPPDRGDGRNAALHLVELVRLRDRARSEEHTSELQSLMRISSPVFCLKK